MGLHLFLYLKKIKVYKIKSEQQRLYKSNK